MGAIGPIAVDAMGGDFAPAAIVDGAKQAVDRFGIDVVLVGKPGVAGDTGLPVIEASEVIDMHDDAAKSIRTKKDSSLLRAAEAVRDGAASAMVSAGNTGATMASALFRMGRLKGVARPAIATPLPIPGHTPTLLVDAGANAECQAEWLVQFGQMGSALATARYGIKTPRVGLLSIGEEDSKGTSLVKEARELLRQTNLEFVGNIEGRDLLSTDLDVVVTDGFTGNVALKTLEGSMTNMIDWIVATFQASDETKAASETLMPGLMALYDELHPDTTGGAMLLGVNGVCVISHGASTPNAMVNAIKVAHDAVSGGLTSAIAESVA